MTPPDLPTPSIDSALLGDAPLVDPEQDLFGRARYAERIAHVLAGRQDPNSLVVGIYGKWGSGKTTALNFIRKSLEQRDNVIVMSFNPWRFSDQDALLLSFFDEFERELGKSSPMKRAEIAKDIAKYLRPLISIASTLGSTFLKMQNASSSGAPQIESSEVANAATDIVDQVTSEFTELDLEKLKRKIEKHIEESDKRLVVLIDDLDRLDKAEIQAVFKLIKLAADFKHVSYVLAFDPDVVAYSLAERYGKGNQEAGHEFLEKIIQVPLVLPTVISESLLDICLKGIEEATRLAEIDLATRSYEFRRLFESGFSVHLTTPRLVKRFSNSIVFTLPLLAGELNALDFVLMEGVRIFYPNIYVHIRDNSSYYLLDDTLANVGNKPDEYRRIREEAMAALTPKERMAVGNLIEYLFPRTGTKFHVNWGMLSEEDRYQRVCEPAYFNRYFAYSIPEGDISDQVIRNFVRSLSGLTPQKAGEGLYGLLQIGGADKLLRKLNYELGELGVDESIILVKALVSTGDLFLQSSQVDSSSFAFINALDLANDLIRRLPLVERERTLEETVVSGEPLQFVARLLLRITGLSQNRQSPAIVEIFERELFHILAQRVESLAYNTLFSEFALLPTARDLLYCWTLGSSRDVLQAYLVEQFRANSNNLKQFLEMVAPRRFLVSQSGTQQPFVADLKKDHYDAISSLLDPAVLQQEIIRAYGDLVSNVTIVSVSLRDSDLPDDVRLAQQFTYLHSVAEQKNTVVIEEAGEVTNQDLLDTESQNEIDES